MIETPAPTLLNGAVLASALADAGVPLGDDGVALVGDALLIDTDESHRGTAEAVVAGHPAQAQAAADSAAASRTNESTIRDRANKALSTNTDFLAIASPNNAQVLAQVKALTRQNNGLIRLAIRRFDGTD